MIKCNTKSFIFLHFLQPILIIFIMAFTTSCQSDNNIDKTTSNSEMPGKVAYVANTSQDNESPWLAFRDEPKYDGKLIYMLPDGTRLKIIGEDSTGNFAKVQIIDNIGYVNKKYLSDSQENVTEKVKKIYSEIQKGKIKPVFIASQTEPFWDIFIMGKYGIFYSALGESYDYYIVDEVFDKNKYSQTLHLRSEDGTVSTLEIIKKQTDNGMSERVYPYTIKYSGFDLNGYGRLNLSFD